MYLMSAATEHSWFNVTTWAERDWQAAQAEYYRARFAPRDYWRASPPPDEPELRRRLEAARADYRRRVLTWYRKLCLPMQIGECTPNRVAEMIAEAWDLGDLRALMVLP